MSETYGQMVQRLREERDWTQEELAQASGVPKRTIQDVEGDKGKGLPQRATRLKLGKALGIAGADAGSPSDLSDLFGEYDDDVVAMLLTAGAMLQGLDRDGRLRWFRSVLARNVPGL